MAFTLDDLLTELEKFYYYSIQFNRKKEETIENYLMN